MLQTFGLILSLVDASDGQFRRDRFLLNRLYRSIMAAVQHEIFLLENLTK
jgi:hypothetical protein